jgi:tetratricopeptide (TPR) repeat protein
MIRRMLPLLLLAALACGCQQHSNVTCDDGMQGAGIVDTDVMAFLSKARAAHHEANVKEQQGKLAEAIAPLEQLVKSPLPRPGTPVPEVEEVLADTYARLADLKLQLGDIDGAEKDIDAGLAHASEPSYYRGHLLEVQGIAEEQRAARLADAGNAVEAQSARSHAITLLRQAVEIQDQVIKNMTARDGGKP